MGRGTAFQALQRFPSIAFTLGVSIRNHGNVVKYLEPYNLWTFPVKHSWRETADLELIKESSESLKKLATDAATFDFIITRPGCGNGRRIWDEVRPIMADLPDNVLVISPK